MESARALASSAVATAPSEPGTTGTPADCISLRAAALLLEGRLTVTEIAEQVGFSSASYMGKCFYEEYGCKPSEYQRRQSSVEQD